VRATSGSAWGKQAVGLGLIRVRLVFSTACASTGRRRLLPVPCRDWNLLSAERSSDSYQLSRLAPIRCSGSDAEQLLVCRRSARRSSRHSFASAYFLDRVTVRARPPAGASTSCRTSPRRSHGLGLALGTSRCRWTLSTVMVDLRVGRSPSAPTSQALPASSPRRRVWALLGCHGGHLSRTEERLPRDYYERRDRRCQAWRPLFEITCR